VLTGLHGSVLAQQNMFTFVDKKSVGISYPFQSLRVRVGVTPPRRMFTFDRQIEIRGYVFELCSIYDA
jgi:hypothetical protein